MNAPNAGAAFAHGFEQAQQRKQQQMLMEQQMRERQEDRELKRQQMQSESALKQLEQHREAIKTGAAIIRQVQPKDQAGWDQALGLAQQYGINPDALGIPRQFDPSYVQNIVGLAEALDPQKDAQDPSNIREYEYAKTQGFRGSYMDFMEHKRGPIVANNGDGTFTIIPRNSPQPADDDEWEIIQPNGGQTPPASGNFRP